MIMKPEITTIYGRVRLSHPIQNDPEALGVPNFTIVTKHINNLKNKVRMQMRDGLVLNIPPCDRNRNFIQKPGSNELIFIQELVVRKAAFHDTWAFFQSVTQEHSPSLQLMREAFNRVYEIRHQNQQEIRCSIEHFVVEEDFRANNNVFYHDGLDAVLLYGDNDFPYSHPYSLIGQKEDMIAHGEEIKAKYGFVFSVEIIDNLGKYGERYVSICNSVYKIEAKADNNKPDGIYIVSNVPTVGRKSIDAVQIDVYAFEDAEKRLGLYRSYEEAASNGDLAAARKREIVELEHQVALAKQEALLQKIKSDEMSAERDRVMRDLEHERTLHRQSTEDLRARQEQILEMERMRQREHYEQRSSDRKDSSEMIKFLPIILTAIGTILMAWKSFKPA